MRNIKKEHNKAGAAPVINTFYFLFMRTCVDVCKQVGRHVGRHRERSTDTQPTDRQQTDNQQIDVQTWRLDVARRVDLHRRLMPQPSGNRAIDRRSHGRWSWWRWSQSASAVQWYRSQAERTTLSPRKSTGSSNTSASLRNNMKTRSDIRYAGHGMLRSGNVIKVRYKVWYGS